MKKSTTSTVKTTTVKSTTKTVKSLYSATTLTKKSNSKLWVAFAAGKNPSTGLVYSSTLSRDTVRNAARKVLGLPIQSVRSRRVENLTSRTK